MAAWGGGTPRANKAPEPIFTPKTNPFGDSGPDFGQDAPATTFPSVVKEGWSLKKGPQAFQGWKRRFIQLKGSNKQLNYYTDETMVQKKGTVFLNGLTIHHIARSTKTSDSQHHGFSIMTPGRTFQFCVASATDRDHWIQKIREIVDAKWDAHKIGRGGAGGGGSISYSSSKRGKELRQGVNTGTPVAASTSTPTPTTPHMPSTDFPPTTQLFSAAESWDDDDDMITTGNTLRIKNNMLKNGHRNGNHAVDDHLADMAIIEDVEDDDDGTDARYAHRKKYKQQRQQQMSEEEAVQRVQQLEHKNDALLDQALQTTYSTQAVAADTAQKLGDQRSQLVNIDKNLHEIDQDLEKTDGILDGMKSWSGMIKRKLKKNKTPPQHQYEAPVSHESTFDRKQKQQQQRNGTAPSFSQQQQQSAYDQAPSANDHDQMQNQKLDELLQGVKALNQTATDINTELEEQDVILDSIDKKMDKVQPKMQQQNKVMNKMLR